MATTDDLYTGLNQFKDYVQANLPFKMTCFTGTFDPSVTGQPGNIPSLFVQTDTLNPERVLVQTFIKIGPLDTDWAIFGQGGGPTPMAGIWYLGTAVPSNSFGSNTDWFFNETTRLVYYKDAGVWVQKLLGAQWYAGAGVPSNALGIDGDWYLRNGGANEIYLKTAGAWVLSLSAGGGSAAIWTVVSANFNIVDGGNYIVDTSVTAITGTLPVTLTNAFNARIKDAKGTLALNNLTIQKGIAATYTIANDGTSPGNLIVDVNYANLHLAYDATNNNVAI